MADNKGNRDTTVAMSKVDKKDRSSGGDVPEVERDLAQAALNEFNKKNYAATSAIISKLQAIRPKDIKVFSNKAVVEYYESNLQRTEIFQKTLTDICTQTGIKLDDIKSSDEVEASVIRLNRCTVLFHLQQHRSAKVLLEAMYNGLESLEESVSIGLCLLLAEVLLALSLPGRALTVVAHTEATFLPQPLPPQTSATKQLHADKDSKSPEKLTGKENIPSSISHGAGTTGNSFNRAIINSHTSSDSITGSSEMRCSADQEILRGKLQLLRVRSLLLMRVLRVAKKELKNFVTHIVNSGNQLNVTLIMLKSQLEYLRGSLKKAVKVLNQCAAIPPPESTYSPSLGVAYYNNLGVIHLGLEKPTLACLYLQKALQELKKNELIGGSQDESLLTQPLYSNESGVGLELCYNLGVTLLRMNKPLQAFDFLIEVTKAQPTNPRLWLRVAECCIRVHKLNILSSHTESSHTYVGSGEKRMVHLPFSANPHDKKLCDLQSTTDPALPIPTLEFGRLCLRNALSLIPDNICTANLTDEQEASGVLPDLHPSGPSPPMKGSQINNVKLTCLACSAYVSLCLGDYLLALRHSQTLLAHINKLQQVDLFYKLLGHLYAGEALVLLGRVTEAITHFDPKQVGDIPPGFSSPDRSTSSEQDATSVWDPQFNDCSGKLLRYNLSVTYAIRGQFDKASTLLKEIYSERNSESVPSQVIMLAIYISIQLGQTEALGKLLEQGLVCSKKQI